MRRIAAASLESRFLAAFTRYASILVPAGKRQDWVREWSAEFWHLRCGARRATRERGRVTASASLAWGLLADAAWLRADWLRESAPGSAALCLSVLLAYCLLCAGAELAFAGSWGMFARVTMSHFFGGYAFVATPAVIVAMATYPLRPLRCDGRHGRPSRWLSVRTRWNLFLAMKVVLTLLLGFLGTLVAMAPIRMVLGRVGPAGALWMADWIELILSAVVVTASMRWALLNQEQRCQRCLRILGQPTRVGPASRNFLDWNGTELVCSDGHGLLHVPEMQGSWCWYDLWVELDPSWSGLFGA